MVPNELIWLETKLVELGMIGANRNYQISFVLDKTCMFTVFTERDGKPWQHSVKALQIIWNHFPQFNATNTIHVDDLVINFLYNVHLLESTTKPSRLASGPKLRS